MCWWTVMNAVIEDGTPLVDDPDRVGAVAQLGVDVTASTIFHGTRTPLTVWFEAAWLMMSSKAGTSALNLQRVLGLGSYQTAWTMLHRYRDVMVVPQRDKLSGEVEMDETFIGGVRPGKRGRGAAGKVLLSGAIERAPKGRRGFGRARLVVIANARSETLREFITANIAPGSVVISDALSSYPNALAGPDRSTSTIRSTSRVPGCKHTSYCPECTGCSACRSDGWREPIRARSRPNTCSPTSTNSSSGSTGEPRGNAACYFSGYWNVPSRLAPSATWISSPIPSPQIARGRLPHGASGPALWRPIRSTVRGELRNSASTYCTDMDSPFIFSSHSSLSFQLGMHLTQRIRHPRSGTPTPRPRRSTPRSATTSRTRPCRPPWPGSMPPTPRRTRDEQARGDAVEPAPGDGDPGHVRDQRPSPAAGRARGEPVARARLPAGDQDPAGHHQRPPSTWPR